MNDETFIMNDEIPLLILNASVARTLRFLLCTETEPSFSKRFSNDDVLSLHIILRHLLWRSLYFRIINSTVTHP